MSLQSQIRLYIILSIVIYIAYAVAIFFMNIYYNSPVNTLAQSSQFMDRLYIFSIIISLLALAFGIYILLFTYTRGLNKYRDIARRLQIMSVKSSFDLSILDFPTEDEFGSLGNDLNRIVTRLKIYDNLKIQKIRTEHEKFRLLADRSDYPVLVIGVEDGEKVVKFYNEEFSRVFVEKPETSLVNIVLSKIWIYGSNQTKPPSEEETADMNKFVDDDFEHAIDLVITTKAPADIKKDMVTLSGDKTYRAYPIEILPISEDEHHVTEVLLIFKKAMK
ncbi:MAG: methyl-accepting chemotaxis protein [Brevinematales bacterium]|nr:methyl-accepting chemotaxis protein [Brevinematales bacterium]